MSEHSILTFPECPEEYLTCGSWVAQPDGWVFGLPSTPGGTGNSCGAMPFRDGTGINSPNCLRGEDWVFMAEWAYDRYYIPNGLVLDPWLNLQGPYNVLDEAPVRTQLANMYANLAELKTVWGSDFDLSDRQVSYNDVNNVLLASLDRSYSLESQQPPATGDIQLERSRVQAFFADMAKMKCTYGAAHHDGSGSLMQKDLYWWSKRDRYDEEPEEDEWFIESMQLTEVNYNTRTQRPMQYDVQFVGLFYGREYVEQSGSTVSDTDGHVLYKLGGKTTLTQNMNAQDSTTRFAVSCNYGGKSLAGEIASILGVSVNPTVPSNGRAYFKMYLDCLYVVVWPKYLQLA